MKYFFTKKEKIRIDIGCGKNKTEGYIGVDIDPNSNADIIASALALPFKDNSIDEIISSHLLEHFSSGDAQIFFNEIYRVLKNNGMVYLKIDRDWTKKRLLNKDITHKHRYSAKEIRKILETTKFNEIIIKNKIYMHKCFNFRNKI